MDQIKFTKTHEWISLKGDTGTVGLTDFAQHELGDIVYVELPQKGKKVKQGETLGMIESVKASSDFFSPASGEVIEVNSSLADAPETVNQSPQNDGWLVKLKLSNQKELDSLLSAGDYEKTAAEGAH
ncbi:MAG: glycine cleavage system protein GcvH [Candidatus Wallbacteria bacterium]|nr:glycine cleavage system protein GcvH [Candidatus Wallbacteria bacterium]